MEDFRIKPREDMEEESLFGKIILRFGAVFLCVTIGFALMLMGYLCAILLELDFEIFADYASICFLICIVMWVLIGLLTPFALFQRFFEILRGITVSRIIVVIAIIGAAIILHWYLINIVAEIIVSIFIAE